MATARTHIARIGITGGIGSGKSAVCAIFVRLGVPVLFADGIAREISHSDPSVKKAIAALFGPKAYNNDGTLHRPYVAALVFSNKALQQKLNAIVHPKVEAALETRIRGMGNQGSPFVMVEAALIYEAGLDRTLDAVVVVDADEDVRIRRVVARDGTLADDARKRMKAQWSQQRKRARAEYVVRNNGSLADLETQVRFLYNLFHQRYHER